MSATDTWTRNVETELAELLARASDLDDGDRWRLVVLLARASLHPAPGEALERLVDEAGALGVVADLPDAAWPDASDVLDALDDALAAADDPTGPIADALLDVDDLAGVLELLGRSVQARAFVAHAVALVELAPEPVVALQPWAVRRLSTLSEDAAASALWRAVESAPVAALTRVLPAHGRRVDVDAVLSTADLAYSAMIIPLFPGVRPVERALRSAAADGDPRWSPVEGDGYTVYAEAGRTVVQIHATPGRPAPGLVAVVVEGGGRSTRWDVPASRRTDQDAWFDLGDEAELTTRLADARRALDAGANTELTVRLEWAGNGGR